MRRLDFAFNMLADNGVATLFQAISGSSLVHLNLRDNEIEIDGCEAIAASIGSVPQLQSLNLRQNQIASSGTEILCQSLESHPSITALDLRENSIRPEGAEAIGKLIGANMNLRYMCLCRNALGDDGAKAIGANLGKASLKELYMQDAHINNEGGEALQSGMSSNGKMARFDLRLNFIDMDIRRAISQICSRNR